ncbi:DUF2089 family protein [Salinispira pacifica]
MNWRISKCPACGAGDFEITKLRCKSCGTSVEGSFAQSRLASLSDEHLQFVEIFMKCRGNIKDVERELGVSYPTVRGRLDRVINAMGFGSADVGRQRREILESLDKNELSPEDAVKALKDLQ